jgi:hypothetical protein
MKLPLALLAFGMPLLVVGGDGLYRAVTNRSQVVIPCTALAGRAPRAAWVKITGCDLDYLGAAYREDDGRIVELLFPVRPPGDDAATPVSLVAATHDPAVLALVQPGAFGRGEADQEAYLVMMLQVVTALRAAREVEGYVRRGVLGAVDARRSLDAMRVPLGDDAVVVDLHARPEYDRPAGIGGVGLLLVSAGIALGVRRQARGKSAAAAAAASAGGGRTWRGLLLLRLDEGATAADIERAPALGPRPDVERTVVAAVPGLRFDAGGRATIETPTLTLSVDIGNDRLAWAAVVHAGGPESAAAIERLIGATGWRIYVPRRGAFLDPRELREP